MKNLTVISIVALTLASCSSGWSEEAKSIYRDSCAISPELEEYCECTLDKVMKASPNPADVGSLDIDEIGAQCYHLVGWSEADKSSYMESCMVYPEFEEYCECTLEKAMEASPNVMDFESVDIDLITSECMYLMDDFIDNLGVEDLEKF